jgi:hypothetical protein
VKLAYKAMPLFQTTVHVEDGLKWRDLESGKKHLAKTGNTKKKKQISPLYAITKKDTLGLIRLHKNQLKKVANSIADFADYSNLPKNKTVPIREDSISFYQIESEEA